MPVRSAVAGLALTGRGKQLGVVVMLAGGLVLSACSSQPAVKGASKPSTPATASGSGQTSPAAGHAAATSAPAAGPAVAVCQSSQLKVAMGATGAVAGIFGGDVLFTNEGTGSCVLSGWPVVVGVTSGGQTVTANQVHITKFGPVSPSVQTVTLNPGATAGIAFSADANGCSQSYQTLRVSPPGSTQYQEISAWLPYLKSYVPSCSPMSISPAVPDSALPNPAPPA